MEPSEPKDPNRYFKDFSVASRAVVSRFLAFLFARRYGEIERLGNGQGLSAEGIQRGIERLSVTPVEEAQTPGIIPVYRARIFYDMGRMRQEAEYRIWIQESPTPDLVADIATLQLPHAKVALNIKGFRIVPFRRLKQG